MIAPLSHIHSVAELDDATLAEFLAVFEIVKVALQRQYNPGYTAYEHGRVGACRVLEVNNDLNTFCHHAHRIVIPIATNCFSEIERSFERSHNLTEAEQLQAFAGGEYVYYETGRGDHADLRVAFTRHKGIPSQFMRRILMKNLDPSRDWNWTSDLNYEQMIDTVARLKGEFTGIVISEDPRISLTSLNLRANVSIDGLAYVGKTTIATMLAQCSGRPMIDTGLIFRYMALRKINRQPEPSTEEVEKLFLESHSLPLRTAEVSAEAAMLAKSPHRRRIFSRIVAEMMHDLTPCILVGRDAWRFVAEDDVRIVIHADVDTRIKRALLRSAVADQKVQSFVDLRKVIESMDASDRINLPPAGAVGIVSVSNGSRPFSATIDEILNRSEVVQ